MRNWFLKHFQTKVFQSRSSIDNCIQSKQKEKREGKRNKNEKKSN
jgi:hypothetical protein